MSWFKRNLYLVIGGVVALGLLGYGGFFLYTKIEKKNEVAQTLSEKTEALKTLVKRKPHPNPDNIEAAKVEEGKLEIFVKEVETHFPPANIGKISSPEFGVLLDRTISKLRKEAEQSGVELPKDYAFTFANQKKVFDYKSPQALASRLAEVTAVCEVLFNARVNQLVSIRRAAVADEDAYGSDYLASKGITNAWAVITPYEVAFDGFSGALEDVLEGFVRSKLAFVVNNVIVEPASSAQAADTSTMPGPGDYRSRYDPMMSRYGRPAGGAGGGMDADLAKRYGLQNRPAPPAANPYGNRYGGGGGSRYGGGGPPVIRNYNPAAAGQPRAAAPTVTSLLDENLLRFTLTLQVVKSISPEEASEGQGKGKKPKAAGAAAAGPSESAAAAPVQEAAK